MGKNKKIFKSMMLTVCLSIIMVSSIKLYSNAEDNNLDKNIIYYTVKEGDNISIIAEKYKPHGVGINNMISRIKVVNNVDNIIYPNQVLKIPLSDNWLEEWKKIRNDF